MALTKGCNKDANDSEVSWTTQGGLGRCRGLCRPSFSKVPCQQTGSPWSCSGKGLYCSVPPQDIKALRSLLMVGLQTTAAGSCLQHGELFYYLSNEWNFHSFQRDPKSVSMQAAFPVGNKTRYSVLDGFSASCSEGKALRKSRRGEETRKGEMQRRKVGCKERQRGQALGVLGCPAGSSAFSVLTCILEGHVWTSCSLALYYQKNKRLK